MINFALCVSGVLCGISFLMLVAALAVLTAVQRKLEEAKDTSNALTHVADVQHSQQVAITQILNGLRALDEKPTLLDRPITTRAKRPSRAVVKG